MGQLEEVVGSVELHRTGRVGTVTPDGRYTRTMWGAHGERRWRKTWVSLSVSMCTIRSRSRATRRAGIVGHVSKAHRVAVRRCAERRRWRKRRKSTRRCCVAEWTTIWPCWTITNVVRLPEHNQMIQLST